MTVENITIHNDLIFEDYLKIPRVSFSSLKESPVGTESEGMRIGSLVHRYLLANGYRYEHADVVIPIASALINYVGRDLIRSMICEKAITADFVHDRFLLPWKGIPDMRYPGVIVVDFKVINGKLRNYCERFNYHNQIRGYMLPDNIDLGLIIAYNRKERKVEVEPVAQDTRWWEAVCLSHGEIKSLV